MSKAVRGWWSEGRCEKGRGWEYEAARGGELEEGDPKLG